MVVPHARRMGGERLAGHPQSAGRTAQQSQQRASTIARNHPELVEEPPPPKTRQVGMGGENQRTSTAQDLNLKDVFQEK